MNGCPKIAFFCVIIGTVLAALAPAQKAATSREVELLWPEGATGARGNAGGDKPKLTIYLPSKQKATGAAVVICPGGGYGHLAMDHEGHQIAEWLNSLAESFTHKGSGRNLLGDNPEPKLLDYLSNERQVTAETPPTFLVHTYEDRAVPAENSVYFYLALRKAKVPAEMHLYQKGRHGFGLGKTIGAASSWPVRCVEWMRGLGLLGKRSK